MPSAWGNSWGNAWANSWGLVIAVDTGGQQFPSDTGGGGPYPVYWRGRKRRRIHRVFGRKLYKSKEVKYDRKIEEYYEDIAKSPVSDVIKQEVAQIVCPRVEGMRTTALPPVSEVAWEEIKQDIAAMSTLLEIWIDEVEQLQLDDDEVILILYS